MVARGSCWLRLPGTSGGQALRAGDLVVFPRDAQHIISNSPAPPATDVPVNRPAPASAAGSSTSLICGYFEFGSRRWNPLLDAMPGHLVISGTDAADTGRKTALVVTRVGAALNAFLEAPGDPWSVAHLAQVAGMSRVSFAGRFHAMAGHTPMQFVTRWRMQRAYELLATQRLGVARVAQRCGYGSEAACSKAFAKTFDIGPGAVRRRGGDSV